MRRQQYLMISIGVLAALVLGFGIPDARGSEPWPGRITGPDGEIFPKQKHPEYFTSAAWTGLALGALSGLLALAPSRLWRGLLLSGAVGSLSGVAVGIAYYRAARGDDWAPEIGAALLAACALGVAAFVAVTARGIRWWARRNSRRT